MEHTENNKTDISTVSELTKREERIYGAAAKSAATKATQLLINSIKEEARSNNLTKDSIADFLGLSICQSGYATQAFNIANVGITDSWMLLDSQATLHLVSNPYLLSNLHTGPGTMAIHCNSGTAHTNKVGELLGFE